MSETENKNTGNGQPAAETPRMSPLPWIAGVAVVLAVAVAAGLWWGRTVTVQEVQFEGHDFVSVETLRSQVTIPLGVSPDSLDYEAILRQAERIPWVQRADIRVEPGGQLKVVIGERRPIALLADGSRRGYVDAEGLVLPMVADRALDLPILYGFDGFETGDTLRGDAFRAAGRFLTGVQSRPVSDATISEVAWTSTEGVVALTNEHGVKLIFGHEDFDTRLRNWEAFLGEVVRTRGIRSMRTVDLRFRGQIVTRES